MPRNTPRSLADRTPHHLRRSVVFGLLVLPFLLCACAAMPEALDVELAADPPSLEQARHQPDAVKDASVRFGGQIAAVENRSDTTLIEVVGRDLRRDGRPVGDSTSRGRFLAVFEDFLDPAVYEEGRQITVVGTLDGTEARKVGEHDYPYPRVRVQGHHLWPELRPLPPPYYYDPWYYRDPFLRSHYDPFFPRHPRHHWR
ncbi:Slp family lipoprotein [Methylonatrum kenyense]|uniref:Slp family lipoprotein n=1 Tax=Methylonatrum kenyense TaxID=455253 RepID=UPI0020BFD66B|nr:Slp family lipoprotein [Methylonatrum kenyense]MCK8516589.1 Slp family lipoprotein [Methylonatrum kenyense]